jgi:branched-chain amino acid transport system substrate-binding protein
MIIKPLKAHARNLARTTALTLALVAASCSQEPELEPGITVAAIYNLNGDQANLGGPSSFGMRLAIDETNNAGGVLDMPVNLVLADGTSDPEVVFQRAESLFKYYPTVTAVMGLSDTDMVKAAAPITAEHGVMFVTSGATSPKLPHEVPDYMYLAAFGDNVQAAAGAEFAYGTLNARKAVVLYREDMTYSQLLHQYFGTRFSELGGEVVKLVPYNEATLATAITRLADEIGTEDIGAELVYLAAGPQEIIKAITLLRRSGINQPILGGDSLDIGQRWAQLPASDVYFTTHAWLGDDASPQMQAFIAAYKAAYPDHTPDAFSALGYDTARLVMLAITDAGTAEPDAVRAAFGQIMNFQGITGTISYGPDVFVPRKTVTIIRITGGAQTLATELMPTSVPAP